MTPDTIPCVDVHELKSLAEKQPITLIDVRELTEWQEIRIPNAIHIPKAVLAQEIGAVAPDKNEPVYLHCRAGVRSLDAAITLFNLGYRRVYSVSGGIVEWSKHGYETIS